MTDANEVDCRGGRACPDFKKGDKVTHPFSPGVYTIAYDCYGHDARIAVDSDTGSRHHFRGSNLTKVAPEPYTPQVGDKVRVTRVREGVVSSLTIGGFDVKRTDTSAFWQDNQDGESKVELIEKAPEPPKPFRAATFVTSPTGTYSPMARTNDGEWINVSVGVETVYDDVAIRNLIDSGSLVVTHEPPTS